MHPAPSIILFTTLSGLGYGLAAVLGLGLLDPAAIATKLAHVLALALIGGGLLSSTLHLGNPQRAWRALSQWRSSWLSREGVMAILTFLPLVFSAWMAIFESRYLLLPGLLGTVLCLVTVYCTGMIYASLKSVQTWNTPLTPLCYLLFAVAGGFVLAGFFAFCGSGRTVLVPILAIMFLIAAWAVKALWRDHMKRLVPLSTPESATGLGSIGHVRLFERPHVTENYLTREMGFKVARKHAGKLWLVALIAGGLIPVLLFLGLLLTGAENGLFPAFIATLAVVIHALGMLTERWLFFAEARHAVMNYYGG
ncbi:DmsC/YnfH family molybdoenzyme membrane anchor subunit [Mesorhizobium sp. YR577]|uniref:dimethyl sulfoxide reductase anchor subunit family protein n=1 Tax=Mesorhizobium sp. YR577 TaxID=1884373 RepID=UPI0008EAE624|nr:DmsC/YnfH family molybdoenzyme membrane anchor subunit [Mesorhizobium sp. YR577]SFT77174.1 DMSO reductase anchor subunit [Mesorhizobium sp. YR577]